MGGVGRAFKSIARNAVPIGLGFIGGGPVVGAALAGLSAAGSTSKSIEKITNPLVMGVGAFSGGAYVFKGLAGNGWQIGNALGLSGASTTTAATASSTAGTASLSTASAGSGLSLGNLAIIGATAGYSVYSQMQANKRLMEMQMRMAERQNQDTSQMQQQLQAYNQKLEDARKNLELQEANEIRRRHLLSGRKPKSSFDENLLSARWNHAFNLNKKPLSFENYLLQNNNA